MTTQYKSGQSARGVSKDDILGVATNVLPYDMGGFRINTSFPLGVSLVASGLYSLCLAPYTSAAGQLPYATGVKSITIGTNGCNTSADNAIAIGESTNYQSALAVQPNGVSSVAVGTIDAQGANSIAIGNGLLGVNGYPGSIGASSIAVGCGKAQAGAAQEISIGGTNSGTSALPLGLSVLPTSTVRFGPYTALVPTSPANSTQIGSGKVLTNQISLGSTGSGTGARGISADDTKCAFFGYGGTRQAEFGYWHCRTAGRTENQTVLTNAVVAPFVLTAAQMRNSWLFYTGAGASTMTTDTAVNILATLPAHQVDGDAFIWKCVADGGNVVLSAGVGVTLNDLTSLTADQVNATHTGYFLVQRTGAATVTISRIYTSYR